MKLAQLLHLKMQLNKARKGLNDIESHCNLISKNIRHLREMDFGPAFVKTLDKAQYDTDMVMTHVTQVRTSMREHKYDQAQSLCDVLQVAYNQLIKSTAELDMYVSNIRNYLLAIQ